MSTQPGGLLPGLEPQGPDTKRLLLTVTVVTAMWMGFQVLMPPTPPKDASASRICARFIPRCRATATADRAFDTL